MNIPINDFLGQELNIGDYVVSNDYNSLNLYKIVKITNKMIKIAKIIFKRKRPARYVYGSAILKIDKDVALMYMLTKEY